MIVAALQCPEDKVSCEADQSLKALPVYVDLNLNAFESLTVSVVMEVVVGSSMNFKVYSSFHLPVPRSVQLQVGVVALDVSIELNYAVRSSPKSDVCESRKAPIAAVALVAALVPCL